MLATEISTLPGAGTVLNFLWGKNGRSGGIRTHDPYTPSIVRYQAALRSGRGTVIPAHHARRNRLFTLYSFADTIGSRV